MAKNVGYAKRSLIDKLGLKSGHRACFHGAPDDYESTLGVLPEEVTVVRQLRGEFDFIQFFTDRRAVLGKRLPALKKALKKDGMLWVSWPKKASGVPTDVTEDVVRETALGNGLVDVKVAAVDDVWSGLKLVYRKRDR
ncbi:MAG TPA: DUF3052 family protein [Candidatus Latescibacteria bacterium]|jgi:hypothetical protein|nr:DUF3052 domain-containing protein [Gemmatimonadaceae bacterium]MDP6018717.1 DUF3052 family protein [Candidatus Latescibacterota bacterium]HJP32273.1 DUF3052 family protein [Candidatus Latescibacterota bacterium]